MTMHTLWQIVQEDAHQLCLAGLRRVPQLFETAAREAADVEWKVTLFAYGAVYTATVPFDPCLTGWWHD